MCTMEHRKLQFKVRNLKDNYNDQVKTLKVENKFKKNTIFSKDPFDDSYLKKIDQILVPKTGAIREDKI